MTDIPEAIWNRALKLVKYVDGTPSEGNIRHVAYGLLSERSRQIERDAKIAEEYQRLARSVMECDCSQEATAYGILADAIRAQQRPMTGFLATLSYDQRRAALAYQGEESHGDAEFAIRAQQEPKP